MAGENATISKEHSKNCIEYVVAHSKMWPYITSSICLLYHDFGQVFAKMQPHFSMKTLCHVVCKVP